MLHPRRTLPAVGHATVSVRHLRAADRDESTASRVETVHPTRHLTALLGCSSPLMSLGVVEASRRGGITCYETVDDGDRLVELVARQAPDLVLVVAPFGPNLPALVRKLTTASRSTRSVVLAGVPHTDPDIFALLREGASGWLPLDALSERLAHALHAVSRGELAFPRARLAGVLAEVRGPSVRAIPDADGRLRSLSPREHDVLSAMAEGATTGEIATRIGVGAATVRGYLASAVRRLGVSDRQAALALFRANITSN